jgi:hypothetical protein
MTSAVANFLTLAAALKTLPVGTAYAVWVGIGAVGLPMLSLSSVGSRSLELGAFNRLGLTCGCWPNAAAAACRMAQPSRRRAARRPAARSPG